MFAIIDIETCGGKFEYRKGRITEICILIHDGLQVVDKFSTLINPECNISPFFTNITGITNEMVADAPKFHEIAKTILELTKDRIFVAHNSAFDYTFIKDEFKSLGANFKRETLCTVRLSRKLMPGKISYSLGRLCESLGIENHSRHRAEGDAMATAKLFDLLLHLKNTHPQYKNQGVDELMARRVDKIKQYILNKLPEECGVYYFLDKDHNIIYIGKSENMYARAMSHFNTKENKGKKMLFELMQVDFVETGSELIALLLESEEIKKHKPKFNRSRVSDSFTHCIDWFEDAKGIINFKIVPYDESTNCLRSFNTYSTARECMESWIDEYILCLRYCGLTEADAVCFHHQIKVCNGICEEKEEPEFYNQRAEKIIQKHSFPHKNFILLDKGRNVNEKAIMLIENGKYYGFGYLDQQDTFCSLEDIKQRVKKSEYYPDANDIIKGWINKNKTPSVIPLQANNTEEFNVSLKP
jgi:DNA polymerase III subunit epsilon